jgi:chromosome segregation ATPase
MTGTAELIARVKQAAADLHLVAKLSNKPPLSAAFILNDVAVALAAQAQEIADETPGTPLGRLNAIGRFAEQRGLCTGIEAKAAELFLMETFDAQAQEIKRLKEDLARKTAGNRALNEQWQAQAQEIERLNEVWHPSEQAARNAEARAEAAEAKVAEQAREIERLTAEAKDWHDAASALNGDVTELGQRAEAAEARADTERTLRLSLEGERNAAEARVRELKDEIDRLQTVICCEQDRRDAIEVATIERCAAIVGDHRVAARIRALAKESLTPPPL